MTLGPAASRSSPREAALALWRQMLRQVEAAAKEKQFSRPRREAAEEEEDAEAEDADAEAVANDSGKGAVRVSTSYTKGPQKVTVTY